MKKHSFQVGLILTLALALFLISFTISAQEQPHYKSPDNVITTIDVPLNTYFSRLGNDPLMELINEAQIWWAKDVLGQTTYGDLPVISGHSPGKAGSGGPEDFLSVSAGDLTYDDVLPKYKGQEHDGIYYWPNHPYIVKVRGAQILAWLERVASNFNRIDPNDTGDQFLVDYENFEPFNFEHVRGIDYEIDVTKPEGQRVVEATYKGDPIWLDQEFLLVTHNFRAGDFLDKGELVYGAETRNQYQTRQIITAYLEEVVAGEPDGNDEEEGEDEEEKTKKVNVSDLEDNWSLTPVSVEGKVLFRSAPEAKDYVEDSPFADKLQYLGEMGGWSVFEVDLSS